MKLWLIVNANTNAVVEAQVQLSSITNPDGAPRMSDGSQLPLGYRAFLVDVEQAAVMLTELRDLPT